MKLILFLLAAVLFLSVNANAQTRIITGKVINQFLDVIPYCEIRIAGTVLAGKTDFDGRFQVEIPDTTKTLRFVAINIEPTNIKLTDSCDHLDLILMNFGTHDFETENEVDRERKKTFKKLPKLHLQAYTKGLFQTGKPCYQQTFVRMKDF